MAVFPKVKEACRHLKHPQVMARYLKKAQHQEQASSENESIEEALAFPERFDPTNFRDVIELYDQVSADSLVLVEVLARMQKMQVDEAMLFFRPVFDLVRCMCTDASLQAQWGDIVRQFLQMATTSNIPCSFLAGVCVLYILDHVTITDKIGLALVEKAPLPVDNGIFYKYHLFRARWLKLVLERGNDNTCCDQLLDYISRIVSHRQTYGRPYVQRVYREIFAGQCQPNEDIYRDFSRLFH